MSRRRDAGFAAQDAALAVEGDEAVEAARCRRACRRCSGRRRRSCGPAHREEARAGTRMVGSRPANAARRRAARRGDSGPTIGAQVALSPSPSAAISNEAGMMPHALRRIACPRERCRHGDRRVALRGRPRRLSSRGNSFRVVRAPGRQSIPGRRVLLPRSREAFAAAGALHLRRRDADLWLPSFVDARHGDARRRSSAQALRPNTSFSR